LITCCCSDINSGQTGCTSRKSEIDPGGTVDCVRQQIIDLTQATLGQFGLRLVRTGKQPADEHKAAEHAEHKVAEQSWFFPVGDAKPWIIPQDLRDMSQPWARVLVDLYDNEASWPGSIVPEGGLLLQTLVRNIQPTVIVETGTFTGVSTIWLASGLQALGRGHVHTYDLFQMPPQEAPAAALFHGTVRGSVERRLANAGLGDLVTLHEGDSASNLVASHDQLRATGGVQFAFLDGDHSPEAALADLRAVEPVLPIGGFVVLHDTFPEVSSWSGPRWLVDNLASVSLATYQVCDLYLAQCNYGLTLLRRMS
jgi:predicted O-methyltransferase YrrM